MKKSSVKTAAMFSVAVSAFLVQPLSTWSKNPVLGKMDLFGVERVYAKEGSVSVVLDKQPLVFQDTQPQIKDGRTLVPVRGVFEAMGYQVNWDARTQTVTLVSDGANISVQVGQMSFNVSGKTVSLDVPAQMINGRVMLPLRAISEATGAKVEWDEVSNTVNITRNGASSDTGKD